MTEHIITGVLTNAQHCPMQVTFSDGSITLVAVTDEAGRFCFIGTSAGPWTCSHECTFDKTEQPKGKLTLAGETE